MREQKANDNGFPVVGKQVKEQQIFPFDKLIGYNDATNTIKIDANLDVLGEVVYTITSQLEKQLALGDGISVQFKKNTNFAIQATANYASYLRIVGNVMVFVASFNITKVTTDNNPIDVCEFTNIPTELFDKLIGGVFLDEQNTRAFIDGTFTSVVATTALVKGDNNNVILRLQTENMAVNTTYHIRHMSLFLLSDNQFKASGIAITNLGASNPLNVVFAKAANFPTESECYQEVVIDGNYFAKFTPWYKKAIYNGNELVGFELSNVKEDDDYVIYDCFLDEDGNVLPYILIGEYCSTSTSTLNSVAGTRATMTIGSGRTLAQALGTGYQIMDASMQIFWRDLALAISQKVDFNAGQGVESYLGMKDMTQGGWCIDGLAHIDGKVVYASKPSKYIDSPTNASDGYSELSYDIPTRSGWITKLGYDSNNPTINLPIAIGGSADTYYCDFFYNISGNYSFRVYVGGARASAGLFCLSGDFAWSGADGVRLCYKPTIQ